MTVTVRARVLQRSLFKTDMHRNAAVHVGSHLSQERKSKMFNPF